MGSILQIRVMAETFDESEVEKRWPRLVGMTWVEPRSGGRAHGVLELLEDMRDRLDTGLLSDEASKNLGELIKKAYDLGLKIKEALGDWRPADASKLSFEIEDLLDEIELAASA
ncbi:hypothetical protein [Maridesulfovibrio bastinii]|jgi:DNA repair ATPase RecN|uniref:hypothetical protein n=1 Tax=Maridesulfovibrio bastinii TaxID=47157 RepID=UPI0004139854|nr:hypothetical protein [Maridesulfovibrio bastinii]